MRTHGRVHHAGRLADDHAAAGQLLQAVTSGGGGRHHRRRRHGGGGGRGGARLKAAPRQPQHLAAQLQPVQPCNNMQHSLSVICVCQTVQCESS